MQSLTVFFPCFNDSRSISTLIVKADEIAKSLTDDYEILVVDDGSRDNSQEVLRKLQQKYSRLRLVFHDVNQGYGGVLRTGFSQAAKELIFYTDGDGQYDVAELKLLWALLVPSVALVNGYKKYRRDPWYRILIGTVYCKCIRHLFGLKVFDVNCDFRLIRRKGFDKIRRSKSSGAVCLELVTQIERAGFSVLNCPVTHYPRQYGRSEFFRLTPLWATFKDLFELWFEFRKI